MDKKMLFLAVVLFASGCIILGKGQVCGGVMGLSCPEGYTCEVSDKNITDSFGSCVPFTNEPTSPNQNSSNKTCILGQKYETSASQPLACTCPEGYQIQSNIIGYSNNNDVESPILSIECIPEKTAHEQS